MNACFLKIARSLGDLVCHFFISLILTLKFNNIISVFLFNVVSFYP